MTIGTGTNYECAITATASNVNGGGFNPLNTNMLTDVSITGANTATPQVTSASRPFTNGDNNHWFFLKTATNGRPGFYKILSQTGGVATIDASAGNYNLYNNVNFNFTVGTVDGCGTTSTLSTVTWGLDYSRSDAAPFTATDLTGSTTACTSATAPFGPYMAGNIINIALGTGVTAGLYELVSISVVTATLDRSAGTTYSACTFNLGGAWSLQAATDAQRLGLNAGGSTSNGTTWIRGGSNIVYNIGAAFAISGNTFASDMQGYAAIRADMPRGATQPKFSMGTAIATFQSGAIFTCMSFIGTGTAVVAHNGGTSRFSKAVNTSTTAGRAGFNMTTAGATLVGCEAISYSGKAIAMAAETQALFCYAHDCTTGISADASTIGMNVYGCIVENFSTAGITYTQSAAAGSICCNNTVYGTEDRIGAGISSTNGASNVVMFNNNVYGCTTGMSITTPRNLQDFNNFFNCGTAVTATTTTTAFNNTAIDPQFVNAVQRKGTTAITTTGNHLVDSTALFQTWGIVPGQDYLRIRSGTGVTATVYGIVSVDSETQITVDNTLPADATANKSWFINTGHNFALGSSLLGVGYPGVFPGGFTTGYPDIGAVQKQNTGGGASSFTYS